MCTTLCALYSHVTLNNYFTLREENLVLVLKKVLFLSLAIFKAGTLNIVLFCVESHLAPYKAERPNWNDINDGGEGNAHDDKNEIGSGETNDEDVGCISHVLVRGDHDDDRQVPDEAENGDETEYNRNDDAHEVLEGDVRAAGVFRRAVGRRRVVCRRRPCNGCFRLHCGDVTRVSAELGRRPRQRESTDNRSDVRAHGDSSDRSLLPDFLFEYIAAAAAAAAR